MWIFLYPKNTSIKYKSWCPAVAVTSLSMCGSGKLSFGHVLLTSVNFIQTLHFPFFFLTIKGLMSKSWCFTSWIYLIVRSWSTSSFTTLAQSWPSLRHFCFIGLYVWSTFILRDVTLMYIPFMSEVNHKNVSVLF